MFLDRKSFNGRSVFHKIFTLLLRIVYECGIVSVLGWGEGGWGERGKELNSDLY